MFREERSKGPLLGEEAWAWYIMFISQCLLASGVLCISKVHSTTRVTKGSGSPEREWGERIAVGPMLLLIISQVGKGIKCMLTLITSSMGADQHFTAHSLTPGD